MNIEKKAQLKKDKARLKELKRRDKQFSLTEDEIDEYIKLLNEDTARIDEMTKKLYIVAFVIYGINFIILIGWLISIFTR